MSGIAICLLGSTTFSPILHTYTASGTETIPVGATKLVMGLWGGGGGGAGGGGTGCAAHPGGAAASGAYCQKTITLTPSDWGKTIDYVVGAAGLGGSSPTSSTSGGNSSITNGTYSSITLNLSALAGLRGLNLVSGSGQAASGGDINDTGNNGTGIGDAGGVAIVGFNSIAAGVGGFGGADGVGNAGGNGGVGEALFYYT